MTNAKSFIEKLTGAMARADSLLCLGLDPDPYQFPGRFPHPLGDPAAALTAWGWTLIEQTADLVCCYKPNFAFYEQFGPAGLSALQQTIAAVPDDIPVLLDAKRGDIGSTATAYARAAFEVWGADGVTLSPYLGQDSIAPFLAYPGKAVFVLGYTSNPSAAGIQEFGGLDVRLFEHIARQGQNWGHAAQLGFVVGATRPQALARFRALAPDRWILAPGVGAQGGDLAQALAAGLRADGQGLIVPVSRGVIYAGDPRTAALDFRRQLNQARQQRAATPETSPLRLELIRQLYEVGCVQFGNFTLASGRQSPIYIDLRRLTASPALLRLAAQFYAGLLQPLHFDHLAAVPYAALTIGAAVALITHRPLIYPRKEVKDHGTGRWVEGHFAAGDTAVVIEDLVTSGGSVLQAIDTLEAAGLVVRDVAVLIDREQGGLHTLAGRGYRLHAALTLSEILQVLHRGGQISTEKLAEIKIYLERE
ncbi:MAG: orotidine-5'-phosphate decarboxylase [Chloroflexota bacterium]